MERNVIQTRSGRRWCIIILFSMEVSSFAKVSVAQPSDVLPHWQLTGSVQGGVATMESTSQMIVDNANATNHYLNREADSFNTRFTAPLVDFTYISQKKDAAYYFRTPVDNGFPLTLGYTRDIKDVGNVDISVFTKLDNEVWKHPYLVESARESTSVMDSGITLQYNDFFYGLELYDVKDDVIGRQFSDLQRDGKSHSLGYTPKIPLLPSSELKLNLIYAKDELDGKSEAADHYVLKMGYTTQPGNYVLNMEMKLAKSNFEKTHPLFEKRRDTITRAGTLLFTWLEPFGLSGFFNSWILNYETANSRIDFFDYRNRITATTIGYRF